LFHVVVITIIKGTPLRFFWHDNTWNIFPRFAYYLMKIITNNLSSNFQIKLSTFQLQKENNYSGKQMGWENDLKILIQVNWWRPTWNGTQNPEKYFQLLHVAKSQQRTQSSIG
jgi:hypothetical protein